MTEVETIKIVIVIIISRVLCENRQLVFSKQTKTNVFMAVGKLEDNVKTR